MFWVAAVEADRTLMRVCTVFGLAAPRGIETVAKFWFLVRHVGLLICLSLLPVTMVVMRRSSFLVELAEVLSELHAAVLSPEPSQLDIVVHRIKTFQVKVLYDLEVST